MRVILTAVLLLLCLSSVWGQTSRSPTLSDMLANATYRIESPEEDEDIDESDLTHGAAFIVSKPQTSEYRPLGQERLFLVTAAHVLRQIDGDTANLYARRLTEDRKYEKVRLNLPIRSDDTPLWVEHPDADVAAIELTTIPPFMQEMSRRIPFPSVSNLMSRGSLRNAVDAGDEIVTLGFPLSVESNNSGFPIMRSGHIVSLPEYVADDSPLLCDVKAVSGANGGPVYLKTVGKTQTNLMGRLVQQRGVVGLLTNKFSDSRSTNRKIDELGLGVIAPARRIVETIAMIRPTRR